VGRRVRVLLTAAGIAVGLTRCGGGGASTPTTPTTPAAPTVTSITVTAPSSSAKPGDSSQFTATAVMSNSTTQTITNQATWQSSSASVATVSSTGFVTAVADGEADIRATYQTVTGSAHITVTAPTPVGNSVCGTVKEEGTSTTLSAATVLAKDTPFSTVSDSAGRYCLTGLNATRYTLRATRSGYQLTEVDVTVNGNVTADISMRKESSPAPTPTPSPSPTPTPGPTPSPGPNGPMCAASSIPSNATCIGNGTPPVTAVCDDGAYSCSLNRSGTCSSHGGVKCWVCPGTLCNGIVGVSMPLDYTPIPAPARGSAVSRVLQR
jgi:hypothetical protein